MVHKTSALSLALAPLNLALTLWMLLPKTLEQFCFKSKALLKPLVGKKPPFAIDKGQRKSWFLLFVTGFWKNLPSTHTRDTK